jgi:hypothetical protein
MPGIEEPVVALASAVVKIAVALWMKDNALAVDGSLSAVDILGGKASDYFQRAKTRRTFEQIAETVAKKAVPFIEREYRGLPDNEKTAAILAVAETFTVARLNDDDLYQNDLNAGYLEKHLRTYSQEILSRSFLSEAATELYLMLLRESCEYLVQVIKALPSFQPAVLTELLRRSTQILNSLQDALDRLPQQSANYEQQDPSVAYRRQIINMLDQMELFGASITESSRRYPLSLAYISLWVAREKPYRSDSEPSGSAFLQQVERLSLQRESQKIGIESALRGTSRLFIRGEAGSGKTTILKWLAVRVAARDLPTELASWNQHIPFFLPLRRYSESDFPNPIEFVSSVGRHLIDELPKSWVSHCLRRGKALVLIDGVDELPEARREEARRWIRELLASAPQSTFIVTSRPGAATPEWLSTEGFDAYSLQPMDTADIREFVKQWHDSVARQIVEFEVQEELLGYQATLADQVLTQQHLRQIAETPLLCALVCALNRERRGRLPVGRLELYDIAMEMLLERRDAESRISADTRLSLTQKGLILQDVAYWLVRNGWADVGEERLIAHIRTKLSRMPKVEISAEQVFAQLLERSGLIREPSYKRVDFVHKSFQDYLAAREALAVDDIGLLIDNGHVDQWRDVVIIAAGLANVSIARRLIEAIMERGDNAPTVRDTLYLVAMACLENCQEVVPVVHTMVQSRVTPLLPPRDLETAKRLASSGDIAVELLLESRLCDEMQVSCSMRLAAEVASDLGFELIRRHSSDRRPLVVNELRRSWTRFNIDRFTEEVIRGSALDAPYLWIDQPDVIPALKHLPNLRHLEVVSAVDGRDLNRLSMLPQLRRLTVSPRSVRDMGWLSDSAIEALEVQLDRCDDHHLRVLIEAKGLESITITNCSHIGDFSPLDWCTALEALRLCKPSVMSGEEGWFGLGGLDVARLRVLANLKVLALVGARDLATLEELEALQRPSSIGLIGCPAFQYLSGISAWSSTLRHLSVARSKVRSLSPLTDMAHLEVLDISYTLAEDLSPLSGLVSLKALNLTGCAAGVDVGPVENLPNLRVIILPDGSIRSVGSSVEGEQSRRTSTNAASEWRSAQKLLGVDFLPCALSDSTSFLIDGSRWPEGI